MQLSLQGKMSQEMAQKEIYLQAQRYAFDYADNLLARRVFPNADAIKNLEQFIENFSESNGNTLEILEQLYQVGAPATVTHTGGRYFGFVNGGVIPAALAARWLSDFWDQNTALSIISPIAAKLEQVVESWLKEIFGLKDKVVAGFVSGSSMAIFCALTAARYRIFQKNDRDINREGFYGAPKVRVIAGRQAHATVIKAIALLGFGIENIEIFNDIVFNQVLVASETDQTTQQTIWNIQDSGECWVGGASWNEKAVIRISVCSWATTEEDISRSVQAFVAARDQAFQSISTSTNAF